MKALNVLATVALAAYAAIALSACSGTSNGSTAAAAATSCTLNAAGQYVDQNGNPCSPTGLGIGGTTICPTTGYYTSATGVMTPCTPGQTVYIGGTTGTGYYPPNNYPYGSNPTAGTGCTSYYYEYGVQYVPIYLNGQLVCANYNDLIASMQQSSNYAYYTTTGYYNNPNYWYAYPPYGNYSDSGYSSGSALCLSGYSDGFSAGACLTF